MKSNGLLKWLLLALVLLVVFVGIKLFSTPRNPTTTTPAIESPSELTSEEMKSLGIEGDTPRDTIATLVAQVKELRSELQTAVEENKQQKAESQRLRQRESAIDQRIETALNTERDRSRQESEQAAREQQQTRSLLQELQHRLDGLGSEAGHADLPVGIGLQEDDAEALGNDNRLHWVEPQDAPVPERKTTPSRSSSSRTDTRFPTSFEPAADRAERAPNTAAEGVSEARRMTEAEPSAKPVYTVPSNSTLIGSIAMTALIGRVPIDGTVNDPYPFRVLIGPDNLTANGIDLPHVAGAVVSGTASGDWTLSCVRGQIRSMTFVFQDGTVRTVPDSSRQRNADTTPQGGLGWISDPHGIPCVSGERRSNAQQYLTSQMLITAAGAGAASLIDSNSGQFSYVSGSNGSALGTVGISGNEAMGRVLAGGVHEMSQWVNKLYGQAFAAIYVQPGAQVAVHIEHPLNIDFESQGRRVNHRLGETHVFDLD